MPRTLILCSGVLLLNATGVSAQSFPKNPAPQQVVGYRMVEQQRWNSQQLPKNSVLYKMDRKYPGWQSIPFNFKQQKQPVIDLSSIRTVGVFTNELNSPAAQQLPFLRSNLSHQKKLYRQWQKESRLKEIRGSMLLRDLLIPSKNRNSLHP